MQTTPFRILIIDDNPAIHQDFVKILNISEHSILLDKFDAELFNEDNPKAKLALPKFQIDCANQGLEGVELVQLAKMNKQPYALAFVDVRMPPGIDGVETIKRIWAIDSQIQIVICSAYSDYSWDDTIRALGLSDNLLVLKKPFDIISVRQIATALTQKWRLCRETEQHTAYLNQLVEKRTESLQQSFCLLRATIESASDGILVVDLEGNVVDYNQQLLKIWDLPNSIIETKSGRLLGEFMVQAMVHPHKHQMQLTEIRHQPFDVCLEVYQLKNTKIVECCSKPHRIGSDTVGRVFSFRDITEQTKLREKLEHQANHDALTGLPNRLLLMERIEQAIQHHAPKKKKMALLFFDLDRFKMINDSLSHVVGDALLCEVAKRLQHIVRQEDLLARLGGDEFVLVCESFSALESITKLAEKILASFERPFHLAGREINMSASIGISIYPDDGDSVNTLLSNADMAMYQAKFLGGNQFSLYTDALNARTNREFELELELQRAITNQEFFLVYQPQFSINNHKIHGMEVLLRWQHPKKGVIMPTDFIPTAESSSLIIPIGEWVLRETCKQIATWRAMGLKNIRIACNVADKQLRQTSFADMIEQMLEEFDIPPECLEMEITENVILDKSVQDTIRKLKKLAVHIVLDDFGTGSSSLNLLKQVAVDSLKIDQSFIQNITKSSGDEAIIDAIIAIAQSMHFTIIAEGVETPSQLAFLKKRHCDDVQGFLMSKPLRTEDMEALLKKHMQ